MKSAYKQQSLETAYTIIYGLNSLYLGIYTKTYMPAIATDLKKERERPWSRGRKGERNVIIKWNLKHKQKFGLYLTPDVLAYEKGYLNTECKF